LATRIRLMGAGGITSAVIMASCPPQRPTIVQAKRNRVRHLRPRVDPLDIGRRIRSRGVIFMNSQDSFGVWQHQGADEAAQKRGNREDGSRGIGPVINNSGSSPASVNTAADVRWCEIVAKQRPLRPTSPTGHCPKPGTVCKTQHGWITELAPPHLQIRLPTSASLLLREPRIGPR
jgi:hypothetical protein